MPKRLVFIIAFVLLLAPAAAFAQIRQVSSSSSSGGRNTVTFSVGYFGLKGIESRDPDDVIVGDLISAQPLLFEVNDLNRATFGGEYLFAPVRQAEIGVGLGFSQRTISTIYANITHPNKDEIRQDIKLRMIPVNFTGRFLILPRGSAVEPYIGAGITAIRYQYSEVGEFVDDQGFIFPAAFKTDGTAVGPIVLAGARAPVQNWTVGGEFSWQKVVADVPADAGFLGTKLDLGGWNFNFTVGVRF
jgi:opacity protein-like surface antigen